MEETHYSYNLNTTVWVTRVIYESRLVTEMSCIDIGVNNSICIMLSHFQHIVARTNNRFDPSFSFGTRQYFSEILNYNASALHFVYREQSKTL